MAGRPFQAFQISGVIAVLPPVKGLWTDTKVAAGESGILPMSFIVIKPM
jgi:hypothetical protein